MSSKFNDMESEAVGPLGEADGPGEAQNVECSQEEIFDVLSSHRRRYAWRCCRNADSALELGDVAEQVAAWENDKPVDAITSSERKRVYTSLQQTHLPKMDEVGIVEFDGGTVALSEAAEKHDVFLDVVPEDDVSWGEYYLGLSGLSGVILALVWAGAYPSVLPALGWATLVVVIFGISAAVHTYKSRQRKLGTDERPPELR